MESKDILKAIGDADDRFVEEAAPEEKSFKIFKGAKASEDNTGSKIKKTSWKKWAGGIAAVLVVCIVGGMVISGIGAGSARKSDSNYYKEAPQESVQFADNAGLHKSDYAPDMTSEFAEPAEKDGGSNLVSSSIENLNKDNLKLIYTANMTLQTSDYDEAEKALSALVERYNGYFEIAKVSNNGMYSTSTYRSGSYTVRIPAESYPDFINAVGDSCHVTSLSQSVQDVGESYYEIEGRLETLYTKQDRLLELLSKASSMYDIIELENALSDTEYQIDSYKGRLNHYDSLIGYSTVYISLETVTRPGSGITQDTSFGARLARAFKDGLSYAADNFEYFILWIAENLIGIIICVVIVILLIRFRPFLKLWRKLRKKA